MLPVALHSTVEKGTGHRTGVQRYAFVACSPAPPGEESPHGPHTQRQPEPGLSAQRPGRSGPSRDPRAPGAAVGLSAVPPHRRLGSSIRAMRETCRDPRPTGRPGRPRGRRWRTRCLAQVVTREAQRRVVALERLIVDGPPARVETLRDRMGGRVPAVVSSHVPSPCWTPPKHHGCPSHALTHLLERWCGNLG